jgi:hypothetical protein
MPHPLEKFPLACKKREIAPTRFVLIVSIAEQTVSLFEKVRSPAFRRSGPAKAGTPNKYCLAQLLRCSTSRFDIGRVKGCN